MEYKIGDKVRLKKGLKVGEFYDACYFRKEMDREYIVIGMVILNSEETKVKGYKDEKQNYSYSPEMLDGLWEEETEEMTWEDVPKSTEPQKYSMHKAICNDLNETYKKKNHDYGDSFKLVRDKVPNAIMVRIYDKVNRLENLLGGAEQKVDDESIEDTLLDLANYCIMEVVERALDKEK